MKATSYRHVVLDDEGVPHIADTTMKVCELAAERIAYGWTPEEMQRNHSSLSLGQIHSALAYYRDHEETIRRDLERRRKRAEALRRELPPPSKETRQRVRALKERGDVPAVGDH
jgi:uncharacterized protein (DUF433 family)